MARDRTRACGVSAIFVCSWSLLFGCVDGTRSVDGGRSSTAKPRPSNSTNPEGEAPLTFRVLLAATVSGGSGGAAGSGNTSSAGSGSLAGAAGASSPATTVPGCQSIYCGDGCHDPTKEECDDGSGSPGLFCNWACQIEGSWASHASTAPEGARAKRTLGRGRHPIAASTSSFAVSLVEQLTPAEQVVRVARYSTEGVLQGDVVVSDGAWVADRADPVVAVLGNGDAVTAFTEFGGDGDGLGIALRRIRAGQTQPDSIHWASEPAFAAQYDADILALSDRILVAYTDEYDAVSGPDITLRAFDLDLKPLSSTVLANASDVEGRVALARLGTSWGAAWRRATADGSEYVEAYDAATGVRWTVGPHGAADGDDAPAMIALDATRRLVVYTRAASGSGAYPIGQLYYALLDTAQPGSAVTSAALPTTSAYTSYAGLAMRRPMALQTGSEAVLAWSSAQPSADPGFANAEEIWYERFSASLSGTTLTLTGSGEVPIPRFPSGRVGDQRRPALALVEPSTNHPGGALATAWEDYGETLGTGSGEPEVLTYLAPLNLARPTTTPATDCTTASPCAAGKGRCSTNNQCANGLVCSTNAAKNFGYGTDIGVCVATHCVDDVKNNDEILKDCGGADCGKCLCGDGILTTQYGEVCDTAGNSATCDSDCTLPVCGDGLVNTAAGEQCDLGSGNGPNATCLANCTLPPTCTNGAACLNVSTQRTTNGSNQIALNLSIVNNTGQSQSLSGTTLRYWFTADGNSNYTFYCDYSPTIPCSAISGVMTTFAPARADANRVMTITLNTSVSLAAGANTGNLQLRFSRDDGAATDQTNDYSYSTTTLAPNLRVGMYRNGSLVWGQPPPSSSACGNGITDAGEVCDNAPNTHCRADCSGFDVVNGTACTNSAQCLSVEQYSTDSPTDGFVRPYLRIVNRSGVPVSLDHIKVRYWFTSDSTSATLNGGCTTGPTGSCSNVTVKVTRLSPTFATADARLSATFSSTTTINAGSTSDPFQNYATRADNQGMNESNDWSQTGATSFTAAPKVTLYVDEQLWWGEEPK